MEQSTVPCVTAVLKEAMRIDKDLHQTDANGRNNYDVKLRMIKCGFAYAMKELETYPTLKTPYEMHLMQSEGSSSGVTKGDTDARIKFGDLIIFLFNQLTHAMEREKATKQRKDLCELSLGQESTVKKALGCLNKIAVLPYIPEGIGPISKDQSEKWWHSTEWKKIVEDKNYQMKQLHTYLSTLFNLMNVSFQVKGSVVTNGLNIVMIAAEVLNNFGDTSLHTEYSAFLKSIDSFRVLDEATIMMRASEDYDQKWFNMKISTLVTDMVVEGNLHTLLRVFHAREHVFKEGNFSNHMPLLESIAFCLVSGKPSIVMSRHEYYTKMVDQFFEFLTKPNLACRGEAITIFNSFINILWKKQRVYYEPQLFNQQIHDRFYKELERLYECADKENLHLIPQYVRVLANLLYDGKIQSAIIVRDPRFRKLFFLFASIARQLQASTGNKKGETDMYFDLYKIIKSLLASPLPNPELLLLWAARNPENLRRIELKYYEKAITRKIEVVGEDNDHLWKFPYGQLYVEAHKPTSTIEIHGLLTQLTFFLIDLNKEDSVEFGFKTLFEVFKSYIFDSGCMNPISEHDKYVDTAERKAKIHSYSSNLITIADVVCEYMFEKLDEKILSASLEKPDNLRKLLQLTILTSTNVVQNMQKEVERQKKEASLDVVAALDEEEEQDRKRFRELITGTAAYGINFCKIIPMMKIIHKEQMKTLDGEVKEVIRQTALLQKLLGEMKEIPQEYSHLLMAFGKDLNTVIAEMEGSVTNDASPFNPDEIKKLFTGFIHERGQGLLMLTRLLKKRNTQLLEIYKAEFHEAVLANFNHTDSYVYLAAINCAAEATLAMTSEMIIPFVGMFGSRVVLKKNAEGELMDAQPFVRSVEVRLRIASVICKVFDLLGTAAPVHSKAAVHEIMMCLIDVDPDIRASAYACLEHLYAVMAREFKTDENFDEILTAIKHTLMCEEDVQVRRNAILVLSRVVAGAGTRMLNNLSDHLLEIYRLINHVLQTDKDDIVLQHAAIAKMEIGESLKDKLMEEINEGARTIRM